MKKIPLLCLTILLLTLCCCGQPQKQSLSFSPQHRQTVCYLDGKLTFRINENLYYAEESEDGLILKEITGEAGSAALDTLLYPGENGDAAYLVNQEIVKLSKDLEKTPLCSVSDVVTDVYTFGLIDQGICYCIKATPEGQTLKMFPLDDDADRTTLHVWTDSYYHDVFPGSPPAIQKCGQYLIMTYRDFEDTLWVYDTENAKMLIEGDTKMAYAAYNQEKLYFIDQEKGSIGTYDLKEQRLLDDLTTIPNYQQGITIACDEDYIYLIQSTRAEYEYQGADNSQTLVYNYEGEWVDTIDLRGNEDARALDLCENYLYCSYMCSTDKYIFFGSRAGITTGLFYVEKSQIGSGEVTIHTLYANDDPLGA